MISRTARLLRESPHKLARSFATTRIRYRPADMETVNTTERLRQLRGLMKQQKVDIYSRPPLMLWT